MSYASQRGRVDAPGWFAALVPVAAAGVVWTSLTSGYAAVAGGWSGGVERWIAAALVVAALLVFGGTLGSRADRGDRRWARAGGAGMVRLAAVAAPADGRVAGRDPAGRDPVGEPQGAG